MFYFKENCNFPSWQGRFNIFQRGGTIPNTYGNLIELVIFQGGGGGGGG